MTNIQVSLAETTADFVQRQVQSGQFATPSEYLGFLVEQAQAMAERGKLDNLLEEGLHSGEPIPFSEPWWQRRKSELLQTLTQ